MWEKDEIAYNNQLKKYMYIMCDSYYFLHELFIKRNESLSEREYGS